MGELERRQIGFIGEDMCGELLLETAENQSDNQSYGLWMSPTRWRGGADGWTYMLVREGNRGYQFRLSPGGPWACFDAGPKWILEAPYLFSFIFSLLLTVFLFEIIFKPHFDTKMIQTFLEKFI
jgi:hypothetical protein